jgi:hypothetical protein
MNATIFWAWVYLMNVTIFWAVLIKEFKTMMYVMSDMRSFLPWSKVRMHVNSDIRSLSKSVREYVMSDMRVLNSLTSTLCMNLHASWP